MAQLEENQHNTLDQPEENQHITLARRVEILYKLLAQLEENQHNTLAQQENNRSFADYIFDYILRPLAKFDDYFSWPISILVYTFWIYDWLILQWLYGFDNDARIIIKSVVFLSTLCVSCCIFFAWFVFKLISKVF